MKRLQRIVSFLIVLLMLCNITGTYRPYLLADDDTYLSAEDAAKNVRQYLTDRVENFVVKVQTPYTEGQSISDTANALSTEVMTYALQHTGVPNEGDYLLWQDTNYIPKISTTVNKNDSVLNVTFTYLVSYSTTAEQEDAVDAAITQLLTDLDLTGLDTSEKLAVVYDYLCTNITCDSISGVDYQKDTAYSALINKTCSSQGTAVLFYRIALELGIDCRVITDTSEKYFWNIVKLDTLYYNLDAACDAGNDDYQYFMIADKNLSEDHIRAASYDTDEFYAAYPMAEDDFSYCYHTYSAATLIWTEDYKCNAVYYCTKCNEEWEVPCEVATSSTTPSCTEDTVITYTVEYEHLDGSILYEQEIEIHKAPGHTAVILPGIAATCTTDGISEGSMCSVCEAILVEQVTIPATGHTEEIVTGIAAGCETEGLTDGSICTVCQEILTAQEVIPALGHDFKDGVCTGCGLILFTPSVVASVDEETGSIVVIWEAIDSADSYEIYRSTLEDGEYTLVGTSLTASYVDRNVTPGTTYFYSIVAVYGDLKSDHSVTASATATCARPVVTAVTKSSTGKVTLSWQSVPGAVMYEIIYSSEQDGPYKLLASTESLSYTHNSGIVGTGYFYQVRALAADSKGKSANSATVYCVAQCAKPEAKIELLPVSGKLQLSWNDVEGAEAFEIYRSTSPEDGYERIATIDDTIYVDTDVVPEVVYYYGIRALSENPDANSIYSDMLTAMCHLAQPQITLTNDVETGKVKISWEPVEGAYKYQVYRSLSQNGDYALLNTVTGTSMINKNGKAEQYYYYKVIAIAENPEANSIYSEIKGRTVDLARPTITLTNVASSGKVQISWKPVEGAVKYKVFRSTEKNGPYTLMRTLEDTSMENLNGVAGKYYYYKVIAIAENTKANSAYSVIKGRTCDLSTPKNVKISRANTGKPKLTWDAVKGAVKYTVYYSTSKNGEYTALKTVEGTSHIHKKAKEGVTYYYKIKAIHSNTNAHSAFSVIRSIKSK